MAHATISETGAHEAMEKELSRLLADTFALYMKTLNCHWNVAGLSSSTRQLFESQCNDLADAAHDIAERIRDLGARPSGCDKADWTLSSIS